jgi:hypothetical protein
MLWKMGLSALMLLNLIIHVHITVIIIKALSSVYLNSFDTVGRERKMTE